MKVLLLCAKAFETMEFSVFIDTIGWAREIFGNDIEVHTCSIQTIRDAYRRRENKRSQCSNGLLRKE